VEIVSLREVNDMQTHTEIKELDRRRSNHLEVALLWNPADNRVSVWILDDSTGEELEFAVDPARALDAFDHPYAYAANGASPEPVRV
jgi:hypothetical protein